MANLNSFDLNLLRVLHALLHTNSTVRAAEAVGLSQPAVSAALGRLRAALGDRLFYRRGQGLAPTAFALTLKAPLAEVLSRVESLIAAPRAFDPAKATDRFRISGSDFFAEMLMPNLAERLQGTAPLVAVHLVNLVPDAYLDALKLYEVDLALIPQIALPDWAESRMVFRSTFDVVARAGHPRLARAGLTPGDTVPLDLLCDIGHVLFSPRGEGRGLGDDALLQVGRRRRVAMTLPVFTGVCRAVAGSDLIALIPAQLAAHLAPDLGLAVYRPPIPIVPQPMHMVWNRRFTESPPHVWLRGLLAELLAPLDTAPPD